MYKMITLHLKKQTHEMLVKRMDAIRRKLERMEAVDDQVRPIPLMVTEHGTQVVTVHVRSSLTHSLYLVPFRNWIACIAVKPDVRNGDVVYHENCNKQ